MGLPAVSSRWYKSRSTGLYRLRRLIIHLSGEVEIGASDGAKRVLRAGDIRLMEDVTGKGHSHNDLTPSAAVYVLLND